MIAVIWFSFAQAGGGGSSSSATSESSGPSYTRFEDTEMANKKTNNRYAEYS